MTTVGPTPAALPGVPRRWKAWISDHDEMRFVTYLTIGGVAIAIILAVIGGFPLDTPMPTHSFGWVEPTCGLTRGSTAIARGDFATAWQYNPAAFLVMGVGLAGVIRTVAGFTTRRWLNIRAHPGRFGWLAFGIAFIALWAYQQQHAEFIINARI
jgi:Protein of unknown function (DUF2752)